VGILAIGIFLTMQIVFSLFKAVKKGRKKRKK